MRVVFRVDASSTIGTGHATRCLALANGLRVAGAEVLFVSRLHEGHICEKIESSGFRVARLPTRQETGHSWNDHAHWLMTSQAVDASETAAATRSAGFDAPDWLIADHYALDRNWEAAMRASVRQIMVIDDLADRPHRCDLLLDQNLGRKAADYDGLVPGFARRMIGPSHALLRPEFAAAREGALAARACRREGLRNILITLGGVDLPNASETVLRALVALPTTGSLNVDLVLGSAAPALDRLRALAPTLPFTCTVSVDVQDMAARMARADLAIGAAGGTAWERCALGLPSLMVVLADNQAPAAKALAQSRAAILLGRADAPDLKDALWAALKRLSDPAELERLTPGDFLKWKDACQLTDTGRKKFFAAYEQRKATEVTHPQYGYRMSYSRMLEVQARMLSAYLRGDIPRYQGFIVR